MTPLAGLVISAIAKELLALVWPKVCPMIESAINHSNGELSIGSVYDKINKSEILLLTISKDGDIIATLTIDKRDFDSGKRIMSVVTAGGSDMRLWIVEVNETLMKLAKEHGCEEIYITGREGWVKVLNEIGYKKIHTTVSMKVE
jgi:hypothetical protein